MASPDEVEQEVERRLQAIREDPDERMKYDRNGDGLVDEREWEFVRRQLRSEIQSDLGLEDAGYDDASVETGQSDPLAAYPDILEDRFELQSLLGTGSQGRALLAEDAESGDRVVVKHLALGETSDWKSIELFEREGEVLENLDHAAIPDYIASFTSTFDGAAGEQFFLVQEFVDGEALEVCLADGEQWSRSEAVDFLAQMFDILAYLQSLNPPVVHRDIKASNVIRRSDGDYALIDFGAVQAVLPEASGSSTVIGTGGYVPPEQLMGRAEPASDLYATGATVLHMMTGTHPAELPRRNMQFCVDDVLDEPRAFIAFLADLTHPVTEDRLQSAEEAREALDETVETIEQERRKLAEVSTDLSDQPRVTISAEPSELTVRLDERRWLVVWVWVVAVLSLAGILAGSVSPVSIATVLLVAVPVWIVTAMVACWKSRKKHLRCDRQSLEISWSPLGLPLRTERLPADEVDEVVIHDGCVTVLGGPRQIPIWGLPSRRANRAVKRELEKWTEVAR